MGCGTAGSWGMKDSWHFETGRQGNISINIFWYNTFNFPIPTCMLPLHVSIHLSFFSHSHTHTHTHTHLSYGEFLKETHELNKLASYPQLTSRSHHIGYNITKVVYRGYEATASLQVSGRSHNTALIIKTGNMAPPSGSTWYLKMQ